MALMAVQLVKSWYKWTKTDWESRIRKNYSSREKLWADSERLLLEAARHEINGSSYVGISAKTYHINGTKVHAYDLLHDFNLLGLTFYDLLFFFPFFHSLCFSLSGSLRHPDIHRAIFFHQIKLVFYWNIVWSVVSGCMNPSTHTPHRVLLLCIVRIMAK